MTISEKVAYVKGVAEGMKLDPESSNEAKLISIMLDILEDLGLTVQDLEENALALGDEIDALSDDLSDVEELLFGEDDEDEDDDEEDWDEDDFFEVKCPNCDEILVIDGEVLEKGSISCPGCKQTFSLETNHECGCGDDCCGHDHEQGHDGCGCGHDHTH